MNAGEELNNLKDKVTHELKALAGNDSKDKLFSAENTFSTKEEASAAFSEAINRLFSVNRWSDISALSSTFTLHNASGIPVSDTRPEVGYFVKIELPAVKTENWVQVTQVNTGPDFAEFTVMPSQKPNSDSSETKHFFDSNASSTFRVELSGTTLRAFEIGENETINNQGEEAGNRAAVNTLIAEGGWAFFQKVQWQNLTDYLVGNKH